MPTPSKQYQTEARETLSEILTPDSTIYTIIRHVSSSGMQRQIDFYVIQNDTPRCISFYVAALLQLSYSNKYEAVTVNGCGMDMCWNTVYNLSRVLFTDHPANDADNTGTRDAGYFLTQRNL